MFVQLATIALMAFVATCQGERVWDGYSAKWAQEPEDGFYHLPQRLKAAKCQGWTQIQDGSVPENVTAVGYRGDPRVTLLFSDETGRIIGHRISFPVSDMENVPINYTANPALTKEKINGTDYFVATAFYEENAKTNTRRIWFLVNGERVEIPTKAEQVSAKTSYHLKRCVTWMAQHFYKINSTTNCSGIFPWFLLIIDGEVIGIGFQALGGVSSAPSRKWFETQPPALIAYTIPDAPPCIAEYFAAYGLTSFHVWFKKNPLGITCKDECTAKYNPNHEKYQTFELPSKRYNQTASSGDVCSVK